MFCSPVADVIQNSCLLLQHLCRRRSEELCWTTWAVATPGAKGVGRLPSRSKWGRYRPKNGFLLAPFLRSVAAYLDSFLAPSGHNHRKTGRISRPKTPLPSLGVPERILFCHANSCCFS